MKHCKGSKYNDKNILKSMSISQNMFYNIFLKFYKFFIFRYGILYNQPFNITLISLSLRSL